MNYIFKYILAHFYTLANSLWITSNSRKVLILWYLIYDIFWDISSRYDLIYEWIIVIWSTIRENWKIGYSWKKFRGDGEIDKNFEDDCNIIRIKILIISSRILKIFIISHPKRFFNNNQWNHIKRIFFYIQILFYTWITIFYALERQRII